MMHFSLWFWFYISARGLRIKSIRLISQHIHLSIYRAINYFNGNSLISFAFECGNWAPHLQFIEIETQQNYGLADAFNSLAFICRCGLAYNFHFIFDNRTKTSFHISHMIIRLLMGITIHMHCRYNINLWIIYFTTIK